ncbi:VanW family protein, partial [Terrisporobacter sp.]|uniref:VanW family protein n=1 Tax=Terrisporobacter sp. TaxID=1965305 RepID=UPI002608BF2C
MKKLRGINLAIIILTAILFTFIGSFYTQINSDKIVKNTFIRNINVGNLTKQEARAILSNEIDIDTITFKYKDNTWKVEPEEIDTDYDIDKTIENAFNINRKGNIFSNIFVTMKSYLGIENDVNVSLNCNEEKVKAKLEEISKEINIEMVNASLEFVNGKPNVTKEKTGIILDIKESINHFKNSLQEGLLEDDLVVIKVEPEVKSEDLKKVDTLLGSYSTRLTDSSAGRVENIKIATERTSGVLLMPGEEFSYNEHTGKRTAENGYKDATVIVKGEAIQGIGGGVCQVSTTLYNSVLYSGLEIVKVKNHSIPSSYVQKGRDAAVTDTGLDFVFKNNYSQPIYIKNVFANNTIICQVYGNSKDKKNIEIVTNIDKKTSFSVKKEKDSSLEEGEEKVIEQGREGYSVSTYRVYYDENKNEIKREKVATSYYPPRQKVIAIGTKKEEDIDQSLDSGNSETNRPQGSNSGNSTTNRPGNSTGNRPQGSNSGNNTTNRPGNSTGNRPQGSNGGNNTTNRPGNST